MGLSNVIYVTGEITEDSFISFRKKIIRRLDNKERAFKIILTSEGGDAYAALAYYDFIREVLSVYKYASIEVYATGLVASAAVLILAAGSKRIMTENAWVMVHEDQVALDSESKVSQIEKDAKHARRLETQWNEILFKVTGVTADTWGKLHKDETYLDADECKRLNLIDEVIYGNR